MRTVLYRNCCCHCHFHSQIQSCCSHFGCHCNCRSYCFHSCFRCHCPCTRCRWSAAACHAHESCHSQTSQGRKCMQALICTIASHCQICQLGAKVCDVDLHTHCAQSASSSTCFQRHMKHRTHASGYQGTHVFELPLMFPFPSPLHQHKCTVRCCIISDLPF